MVHLAPARDRRIAWRAARSSCQPRVPMPELPVEQRMNNFAEVEGGYDDEQRPG